MAAAGRHPPMHIKIGAALGYCGDVLEITTKCLSCGSKQTEPVDGGAPARQVLAGITCLFCGRVGAMKLTRI